MDLTAAGILDGLNHLTFPRSKFINRWAHPLDTFGDHATTERLVLDGGRHIALGTIYWRIHAWTFRFTDGVSAAGAFVPGDVLNFALGIAFRRFFLGTRVASHIWTGAAILDFNRKLFASLALVEVDFGTSVRAAMISGDAATYLVKIGFNSGVAAVWYFQLFVAGTNGGAILYFCRVSDPNDYAFILVFMIDVVAVEISVIVFGVAALPRSGVVKIFGLLASFAVEVL